MCQPSSIHPAAQAECDDIRNTGTLTESILATDAWVLALAETSAYSTANLQRGRNLGMRGKLYLAKCKPIGGRIGVAVVAIYPEASSSGTCWDIYASDVTAHSWWHKSDPEDRADQLLP